MDRIEEVLRDLRAFVAAREWDQFHNPKNLAMAVASEAGELLAEYRWVSTEMADDYSREDPQRTRITAEAADVGIALLLFCERVGIDILEGVQRKLRVNEQNYPIEKARGQSERPH